LREGKLRDTVVELQAQVEAAWSQTRASTVSGSVAAASLSPTVEAATVSTKRQADDALRQVAALTAANAALSEEYGLHRKRALGLLQDRDDTIAKLTAELTAVRKHTHGRDDLARAGDGRAVDLMAAGTAPPATAHLPDPQQWAYLRAVLKRFLSMPPAAAGAPDSGLPMVQALAMAAGFTPGETSAVLKSRSEAAGGSGSGVSSLFGW